jgi:hypothetical protein
MSGWVKTIFESLFSSIAAAIAGWMRQEQAEAAKAEAKAREAQLDSVREGLRVQAEIAREVVEAQAPTTGAGWNAGLLLLVCLSLSGCFRFHVYSRPYQPVPPLVERPHLADESPFNDREQALASYAVQLEAALHALRAWAIEQNEQQGYPVSAEDAQWLRQQRSR